MTNQRFLSDNASPAHPAIIDALTATPSDHFTSYGDDPLTSEAVEAVRRLFDHDCGVYFVYNGTGANVAALRTITQPYEAVVCTAMAHINEDEAGAPEAIGGFKLLPVEKPDGRLSAADLEPFPARRGFEHTSQPAVVSVTQSTEVGTVYPADDLKDLCDAAHRTGFSVHMDGARLANAAVFSMQQDNQGTSATPAEAIRRVSRDAGVDVLSFGATKNGLLFGEAVVFFNRDLERAFRFFRKQTTQLHSKMRYIGAQFSRYLQDDMWFDNALQANLMASRLATGLQEISGVEIAYPVQANGVFVRLPPHVVEPLQREFGFYLWSEEESMVRFMVSWDVTAERVDQLITRCGELNRG